NIVCLPKPPRSVPVLIGGGGEKVALRIVAEQADIWNNRAGDQAVLGAKLDVLRGHCEAVGRDFNEITISQQCLVAIAPDEESAGPMVESAQKIFGGHLGDPAGPMAISGSPATVRARIQQHIDLGCTMFQVEFFGRDPREPARLFAETVMPHFR
ncbi:MAG: LLM class flavin-dependent oxidoreductase, partial [Tepidiformaceae bacterium]